MPLPAAPFQQAAMGFRQGKVRDIYNFGNFLLLVATDRISVFDVVLPTEIPDKGRVLNLLSAFWFRQLGHPHHYVTTDLQPMDSYHAGIQFGDAADAYEGRCMLVWKYEVVPFECVVRGYLVGSGWKDYKKTGAVCGIPLPPDLVEAAKLPEPIFTPATKAETGHDENVSFEEMVARLGDASLAETLRQTSIALYAQGAAYAAARGIILADTKFEFGATPNGSCFLIDEVLTPDSSRFWPADSYQPGRNPPSFDKQSVRDFAAKDGWDKQPPGPVLSPEVVIKTREKYLEAYTRLTGERFPWA